MTELLTAAQMRAIEQAAIDSGAFTGLELMERAGRGVVEAVLDWRPELALTSQRAVVLCGPGNNGGDGLVVARLLKQRGWEVDVFLYGDEEKLPPDAAENARRWQELGTIDPLTEVLNGRTRGTDLCIDALFGIGISRPLASVFDEIAERIYYDDGIPTVAIDGPSGLCLDSGRVLGKSVIQPDLCVTFHRRKVGHLSGSGPAVCCEIKVVSIGLDQTHQDLVRRGQLAGGVSVTTLAGNAGTPVQHLISKPKGPSDRHKYDHGHALILSGGVGKGGAARLASRGALRIGAGLVTVGCPPAALIENAARLDAVMLTAVRGEDALADELAARKINAVCIGPGFGTGARLRTFVTALLGRGAEPRPAVVLDADALSEYAADPETLFAMLHKNCVLTPHEGEFGRLFPDILAKLKEPTNRGPAYSKVDATRAAAARTGCVVLFKGADTVIAAPDGRCAINAAYYGRSAPWLATAGSGDVLAGFITGLLARGLDPMQAAETAAWLHVECALKFGPGLIAEDLPEQLPAVFRDLDL